MSNQPTEQDILREHVAEHLRLGYHELAETKVVNSLMQLIEQHTAIAIREARIDEVNQAISNEHYKHEQYGCTPYAYFSERINELTKERSK